MLSGPAELLFLLFLIAVRTWARVVRYFRVNSFSDMLILRVLDISVVGVA